MGIQRDPLFEGAHFHSLFLFTYFIYILYKIEILFKKTYFLEGRQRLLNLQIHHLDYIYISICSGKRAQKKATVLSSFTTSYYCKSFLYVFQVLFWHQFFWRYTSTTLER